jgi:uncharacterized protein (DUF1501 family)
MSNIIVPRRNFLANASALGVGGAVQRLGLAGLSAAAGFGSSTAIAQTANDYKALVCVFLFGGNDGNAMVMPYDQAAYDAYAAIRTVASGINVARPDAAQAVTSNGDGKQFFFHPNLGAFRDLFRIGKLAVQANVGTLMEPLTRAQYVARSKLRPENLFSHSDQTAQWQSSTSRGDILSGWGGRIADRLTSANGASVVPLSLSFSGSQMFGNGITTSLLALPTNGNFGIAGAPPATGTPSAAQLARMNAISKINGLATDAGVAGAGASIFKRALDASALIAPITSSTTSAVRTQFTGVNSGIGNQLFAVARMIEARQALGHKRDIFFVSQGGYDTHSGQPGAHANLYAQLGAAMLAFYQATLQLGVADQVTSATLSDFGRTFKPASGAGTDHAWGNHQVVMGGAVQGGKVYGNFPVHALGGADDAGNEGRWIPTTSVDQFGATLSSWFGASNSDLDYIFPNLNRFASRNVGFMG